MIHQARTATIKSEVAMFNDNGPKWPPAHIFTKEETEMFELIQALLQTGGKVIGGNEWVNDPQKAGYYRIKIQHGDKLYVFESKICTPMIFGPSES